MSACVRACQGRMLGGLGLLRRIDCTRAPVRLRHDGPLIITVHQRQQPPSTRHHASSTRTTSHFHLPSRSEPFPTSAHLPSANSPPPPQFSAGMTDDRPELADGRTGWVYYLRQLSFPHKTLIYTDALEHTAMHLSSYIKHRRLGTAPHQNPGETTSRSVDLHF